MDALLTASGLELGHLIRTRQVSSLEVVEAHIRHIEAVNPTLNAMVADRFGVACAEARAVDETLSKSEPDEKFSPYLGVPCTIKESFALEGMPNSSGLVARKDVVATEDATAVARMRQAGLIPLGVTNVSELCMWMESNNKVYGRSNNPYDPTRIVGGSSGGEGAIVGAGGSPIGLGADIGGSIRMPAFFNGVFGHKPTGGTVPGTGQYPIAENEALRYLTTGPITRRAEDLWPMLEILSGPDGRDELCTRPLFAPRNVSLRELRVIDIESNGVTPVSADLHDAQKSVADLLERGGARRYEMRIESLRNSLDIWSAMMSKAADTPYAELLGDGTPVPAFSELLRFARGSSPYTLPSLGLALIEKLGHLFDGVMEQVAKQGLALKAKLTELLDANTIILYPSYASPAPKHIQPLFPPFNWQYTAIINVMELPSTQVPLGLNTSGLPLGVQVVGGHGNDALTIAVAEHIERNMGGWIPPDPGRLRASSE